jgi:Spy/CpxP family protein refolding chaperone
MKKWLVVAAVLSLAAPVLAQETQDMAERMSQMLKQSLQLSDDQTAKVKDIMKKQTEDIRGVLNDDQKKRYDDMSRMMGGFGRGRDRGQGGAGAPGQDRGNDRGGFGGRGSWLPPTDELKTQLGLTDEQVSKINAIRDAAREEGRNFFRNRPEGTDPRQAFEEFQQKSRESTTQKIREVLTDEQKPKFDEALKNYQGQQERDRENRARTRAEETINHLMEELKFANATEADAVKPHVKKVLDLVEKLDTFQREGRTKLDTASRNKELSEEAVGDTLKAIRDGVKEIEKELSAARKELLDVVNNRQELELIRHGALK